MVFAAMDRLKHRIHNFRMPIKNKRVLFAVKTLYFFTPIVLGTLVMQVVTPDPAEMRRRFEPTEEALRVTEAQKAHLRATLLAAEAAAAAASSGTTTERDRT
mmetsp:Transcript_48086/g.111384  ORF Transcript_48086/g.111384 Transcript_48086/m.111384 type:complete len:102 (-) Transcript_48086:375-680(-)